MRGVVVVRRYDEIVEVRLAGSGVGSATGGERWPDAFVWRGRLFVVREVLDTWLRRHPWWRLVLDGERGGVRRLAAEALPEAAASSPGPEGPMRSAVMSGEGGTAVLVEDLEERVWRVEASAGRLAPLGVYELVRSADGSWRLGRVDD